MFEEVFNNEDLEEEYLEEYDNIAEMYEEVFSPEVVKRGEEYYYDGLVQDVVKLGDLFIADVEGSEDYTVHVHVLDNNIEMSCTCPCEFECKHEYATLLAIENGKYEEKELKPFVDQEKISVEEIIRKIPAETLKKYILSDVGKDNVAFNICELEKTFNEYFPKQSYDYYYNNLYNSYLLRDSFYELYDSYYEDIRKNIDSACYEEAFNIIKAIVEVSHDLELDIIEDMPELGMYLRISYRKADKEVKKVIEKYVMYLIFHQYYNNCYLEDMIININ